MPVKKNTLKEKEKKESLCSLSGLDLKCVKKYCCGKALVAVILLLIVLSLLGYFYKDKFIAATVNGKPVFRYQLNQRLSSTYGKETLENIIVEKLIGEEAKKKGILVTDEEISAEVTQLEQNLGGGMKIEDALSMQGMTLADFKSQLVIRLQVNKILESEISISDQEVNDYVMANAESMIATDEAERKAEALQIIKEGKISERIQTWVQELLDKAKITRLLK